MSIQADYLKEVFLDLPGLVEKMARLLAPRINEFDAIVFRGMSGALVAPMLAVKLGKPFVLVRKPNDGTHSAHSVEGETNFKTYVIVDDLICSGDTVREIQEKIYHRVGAKCVGLALWFNGDLFWRGTDHYYRHHFMEFADIVEAPPVTQRVSFVTDKCPPKGFTATQVIIDEMAAVYRSQLGGGYITDVCHAEDTSKPNPDYVAAPMEMVCGYQMLTAGVDLAACPGGGPEKQ